MDKIAILSDIHGNLPALQAVLRDISARGIRRIQCLGDLVGKGPEPAETVDLIRETCEAVCAGNWEGKLADASAAEGGLSWLTKELGHERINYLRSLPFALEWQLSGKRVRLFHASAKSLYHRVQPWSGERDRLAMFENTPMTQSAGTTGRPDIVGYGDIHRAFVQYLNRKMLFNAGSVGTPRDVPLACYAVLEGTWEGMIPAPFSLQFVRVPFNLSGTVRTARRKSMPGAEEYIRQLTQMRPGR